MLILRRPVDDILVGWHVQDGYMWPYVLLAYLFAIPILGRTLRPGQTGRKPSTPSPALPG